MEAVHGEITYWGKSNKNMSQKQLIMELVREHGSILPAKMAGVIYKGIMFGSETSKRCRELRAIGSLKSHGEGKFEVFTLTEEVVTPPGYVRLNGELLKIVK